MRRYGRQSFLNPYKIPKGFILEIDTREQAPLFTSPPEGLIVCHCTLHNGDYSVKGFEDRFGIERKQMSDLYSYIGKERSRTVNKLKKLGELDFAGLVVETSFDDLKVPFNYSSRITPEMVRQFLVSINIRYGIHLYCSRDRSDLEMWILDRAIKYFKVQREV